MESALTPPPRPWTSLERLGFRIAFLYFFFFIFFNGFGNIFSVFPVVGEWIYSALTWPMHTAAAWVGRHLFHLSGLTATWHDTGSGDTALNWIESGLFIVFAVAGGLLWTARAAARGNRRTEYRTLHAWLRFLLRLTLGYFMLRYGLAKLYPGQMAPISIGILNEPVGNISPMTLLWSLIAFNPVYESICGLIEALAGACLLFRRTALLGALLTVIAMTNIVLFNFFFDVPVKLLSVSLLVASLFLVLPDVRPLVAFFWGRRPAVQAGDWLPPATRRSFRIGIRVVELGFAAAFLIILPIFFGIDWQDTRVHARTPSPLLGAWRLDTPPPATGPFLTAGGEPAVDFYVDTVSRAFTRSADGALWRTFLHLDPAAHTMRVVCYTRPRVTYLWEMPDPDHLTLTSIPSEKPNPKGEPAFTPSVLTFTRIPVPTRYPLLTRGFHWVSEWAYER